MQFRESNRLILLKQGPNVRRACIVGHNAPHPYSRLVLHAVRNITLDQARKVAHFTHAKWVKQVAMGIVQFTKALPITRMQGRG